MFPEGWLIHPEGKFLFLFQKDTKSLNGSPKGYLDKWVCIDGTPTTFKNRREVSASDAISKWIQLTEDGWRRVERQFGENAA
tara:strand:- start:547 stop:792 length:246 start_codon:yes stop_codon:yes gene_type:complete